MKIIDILNKIANGEEAPKKIKYTDEDGDTYIYELEKDNSYWCKEVGSWLFSGYEVQTILNDEVEILDEKEDKKIEKCEIKKVSPEFCITDKTNEDRFEVIRRNIEENAREIEYVKDTLNKVVDKINEVE